MHNKLLKFSLIFTLTVFLMIDMGLTVDGDSASELSAERGVSDFRAIISEAGQQKISLRGEWEFYWEQLLEPDDIAHQGNEPSYIQVPSSWKGKHINGEQQSGFGYGTYRLQLKVPQEDIGTQKALYLKNIGSAYRIWIDGIERNGFGVVGTSIHEEIPQHQPNLIYFEPERESVDLVMQVSNFSFREGGLSTDIVYGDTDALIPSILKKLLLDMFIVGGFLFLGMYQLIIYGIRKTDLSNLLVGLFALAIAGRTLFLNEYLLHLLLPALSWELGTKMEYLLEVIGFLCLVLLMNHMYPKEVHRMVVRLFCVLVVLYCGYILFTPARIYTSSLWIHALILVVIFLYFVFYVGIRAALRKREGAYLNMIGILILVVAVCNDTLYHTTRMNTIELINYSVFMFIMLQAVIVSYRYSLLLQKNNVLTEELFRINYTLEEKVVARTGELNKKNEELLELHHTKTKMLANIAHDLGSPIIGIQANLQLMKDGRIPVDSQNTIQQLLEKTTYINRLNHDLFELSKLESNELKFRFAKVPLKEFIQDVFRSFESDLKRQNLLLQLGRLETKINQLEVSIMIDRLRILQVLQNYIENAVKFSHSIDHRITLNCYVCEHEAEADGLDVIRVEVMDYGMGIAEEELAFVFNRFYKKREGNDEGSGLGLAISKEIIEQHNGRVGVESELGKGSTFYFLLPVSL